MPLVSASIVYNNSLSSLLLGWCLAWYFCLPNYSFPSSLQFRSCRSWLHHSVLRRFLCGLYFHISMFFTFLCDLGISVQRTWFPDCRSNQYFKKRICAVICFYLQLHPHYANLFFSHNQSADRSCFMKEIATIFPKWIVFPRCLFTSICLPPLVLFLLLFSCLTQFVWSLSTMWKFTILKRWSYLLIGELRNICSPSYCIN